MKLSKDTGNTRERRETREIMQKLAALSRHLAYVAGKFHS
jgi:hypothetical protein